MNETKDLLREEVAAAVAADLEAKATDPGPWHPDPEDLIAYHSGTHQGSEAERVQDHLLSCRPCLDLLLDLDRFVHSAPSAETSGVETESVRFETAAAWRALRPLLRPPAGRGPIRALAASLLVAVIGLGLWGFGQWHFSELLGRAQTDTLVVGLAPLSSGRRSAAEAEVVELREENPGFTVVLRLSPDKWGFGSYVATIVGAEDAEGEEQEELFREGITQQKHGTFTIDMPRDFLEPGDYLIRLFGVESGREELVETYPFTLRLADQGP